MSNLSELVMSLSNAFGPSGFEKEVRDIFERELTGLTDLTYDNLGSIAAIHHGKSGSPRVLLAAHLDEVGLMVRGILPSGYLKVVPLGSWWPPALLAQRVVVRARHQDYIGVVGAKPPHYMMEEERNRSLRFNDIYIDVGARSLAEVEALGICVGDPVVPAVSAALMGPEGAVAGKAFDDRVGCAAIIEVLKELDHNHPNQVIGAGTVQEENGIKGARTLSELVRPDLCLVVEGAPADDFPDAGSIIQGRLGGGPQLRHLDPSMISNQALVRFAINQARDNGIPYQVAVREGGGTDAREIQVAQSGVPTVVIGVPVRYAHSHQSVIKLCDLENTVRLLKALIYSLDEQMVANLKKNPW